MEKNADTALGVAYAAGDRLTPALTIGIRRVAALAAYLALVDLAHVAAVAVYPVALVVGAAASLTVVRRSLASVPNGPASRSGEVLRRSWPFFIANVTASLRTADVTCVSALSGAGPAGLYSAAQRLTQPFLLVPTVAATLILPHASRSPWARARQLAWRLTAAHLLFLVPLAVLSGFSGPLMGLFFGADYAAGASMLVWTLLGFPFVALAGPLGSVLQGQGHERVVARNGMAFAILLTLVVPAGILLLGPLGAAVGIAVVYVLKCVSLVALIEALDRLGRRRLLIADNSVGAFEWN